VRFVLPERSYCRSGRTAGAVVLPERSYRRAAEVPALANLAESEPNCEVALEISRTPREVEASDN